MTTVLSPMSYARSMKPAQALHQQNVRFQSTAQLDMPIRDAELLRQHQTRGREVVDSYFDTSYPKTDATLGQTFDGLMVNWGRCTQENSTVVNTRELALRMPETKKRIDDTYRQQRQEDGFFLFRWAFNYLLKQNLIRTQAMALEAPVKDLQTLGVVQKGWLRRTSPSFATTEPPKRTPLGETIQILRRQDKA